MLILFSMFIVGVVSDTVSGMYLLCVVIVVDELPLEKGGGVLLLFFKTELFYQPFALPGFLPAAHWYVVFIIFVVRNRRDARVFGHIIEEEKCETPPLAALFGTRIPRLGSSRPESVENKIKLC